MEKRNRNVMILSIVALVLVLIGVTYAYFSAQITGIESASTISLTAGKMGIVYSEGDENVTVSNIYPREEAWVTKTFTLIGNNTTEDIMVYRVGLKIISSGFNTGDLQYSLTNTRKDSGVAINDGSSIEPSPIEPVAENEERLNDIKENGTTWFGYGYFVNGQNQMHDYELKIYFKDTGEDQNNLQNAVFNAKIVLIDEGNDEFIDKPVYYGWNDKNEFATPEAAGIDTYGTVIKSNINNPMFPFVCGKIGSGILCVNWHESTELGITNSCNAIGGTFSRLNTHTFKCTDGTNTCITSLNSNIEECFNANYECGSGYEGASCSIK